MIHSSPVLCFLVVVSFWRRFCRIFSQINRGDTWNAQSPCIQYDMLQFLFSLPRISATATAAGAVVVSGQRLVLMLLFLSHACKRIMRFFNHTDHICFVCDMRRLVIWRAYVWYIKFDSLCPLSLSLLPFRHAGQIRSDHLTLIKNRSSV